MFYSCATTKSITYFQGQGATDTARYATLATLIPPVSRIQPNDVLAIIVTSLSDESNALFNILNTSSVPLATYGSGTGNQPLGYLVDPAGNVEMPLVGKVKLSGLTLEEAGVFMNEKLSKYLKEPTVNVRHLNHKFTVIGEVTRPGVYNLLDNHRTLPEVIGIAGDLTVFGRRDNVMILRTTADKREIIKVDLTNRQVLDTPYYFIQNNDVVYVESRPGKVTQTDRTIQLLPIFVSITSAVIVIVNILVR
ncbi:polysaccharide biosynthesis/export family protein [Spirosoma agri]|nr:polysaccharide biosynthesis/export family protein [Spirosoma agri]